MKLKPVRLLPLGMTLLFLLIAASACVADEAKKENIKAGSSCEGIDPMAAKMVCVDNNILFCSSFTGYKFKVQTECKEDQVCELAASGKSASCKPK